MLEAGGYVALFLLAVEVALIFLVALGKTTKAAFAVASLFVTALAMFFWLDTRVSEITIASVGTIKTAANLANQYVEDIKKIKSSVEAQGQQIGEEIARLKAELSKANTQSDQLRQRLADRQLTDEQIMRIVHKLNSFANQEYEVTTFWDLKEPLAISNRIHQALERATWKYVPHAAGTFLLGGMAGVHVWVHPEADQRVREAANALVGALNDEDITAELRQQNPQSPNDNRIALNVGTKL